MENFKEKLEIDQNALDQEWLNQPKRFYAVSEDLAHAKKRLEKEKLKMEIIEAELYRDIKTNSSNYGLEKVTEAAIASTIKLQSKYEDQQNKIIEAKHEADIFNAGVSAFDQRKKALENMVFLFGQQYFASPKIPKGTDGTYIKEAEKKKARSKIHKKLNKEE